MLDRWRLIRNLTNAVERAAARHHHAWTTALREHAERERDPATDGAGDDAENDLQEAEPAWLAALAREGTPREVERKLAT